MFFHQPNLWQSVPFRIFGCFDRLFLSVYLRIHRILATAGLDFNALSSKPTKPNVLRENCEAQFVATAANQLVWLLRRSACARDISNAVVDPGRRRTRAIRYLMTPRFEIDSSRVCTLDYFWKDRDMPDRPVPLVTAQPASRYQSEDFISKKRKKKKDETVWKIAARDDHTIMQYYFARSSSRTGNSIYLI